MQDHVLHVPDELIAWGKRPEIVVHHASQWAREVETLAFESQTRPLDEVATERFFSRLEALCCAALRAGEDKLLCGLDIWTAGRLGLSYRFATPEGDVTFGPGQDWSYGELRAVLESEDPSAAIAHARAAKALLKDVFGGRIATVTKEAETSPSCAGCGMTEAVSMVELDTGSRYCPECWRQISTPWPKIDSRGRKVEE